MSRFFEPGFCKLTHRQLESRTTSPMSLPFCISSIISNVSHRQNWLHLPSPSLTCDVRRYLPDSLTPNLSAFAMKSFQYVIITNMPITLFPLYKLLTFLFVFSSPHFLPSTCFFSPASPEDPQIVSRYSYAYFAQTLLVNLLLHSSSAFLLLVPVASAPLSLPISLSISLPYLLSTCSSRPLGSSAYFSLFLTSHSITNILNGPPRSCHHHPSQLLFQCAEP